MRVDDPVSANRPVFRPDRRRHIHSAPLLANLMRKYRIDLKHVLKIDDDDDIRGDGDNCKIEIFKEDCLVSSAYLSSVAACDNQNRS